MAADLGAIRTKVRRLTRTPSLAAMTDAELDEYINTFILYDFPNHLRLMDLHTTLTWVCNRGQDWYPTDLTPDPSDPLYNFHNRYITTNKPAYVDGYPMSWSQSREEFFGVFPMINGIQTLMESDGTTGPYTATIMNLPIQQNSLLITSIDATGENISLVDYANFSGGGVNIGGLSTVVPSAQYGLVDYETGGVTFSLPTAPPPGTPIKAHFFRYAAARPVMIYYGTQQYRAGLSNAPFFENRNGPGFMLRPIPNEPYQINIEVFKRPTSLIETGQMPELEQWWQYYAYGAAKKIFEDRMDPESVQTITAEMRKQENLVQRRTIVQQTSQRSATIYAPPRGPSGGRGWGWGWWPYT